MNMLCKTYYVWRSYEFYIKFKQALCFKENLQEQKVKMTSLNDKFIIFVTITPEQ